jgi:hypothetical protein
MQLRLLVLNTMKKKHQIYWYLSKKKLQKLLQHFFRHQFYVNKGCFWWDLFTFNIKTLEEDIFFISILSTKRPIFRFNAKL